MAFNLLVALQGLVALVTALLYAYVAALVRRRRTSPEAHRANTAFALWWASFGLLEFLAGAYTLPASFGYRDVAMVTALLNILVILIALAIGALVYYLVYLYTGSERALPGIVVAYTLLGLLLLYLVAWMDPVGYKSEADTQIQYRNQLQGAPAIALSLAVSLPVIVAALGYGSIFFRTREREQRFRVALVAGSFLVWFGWSAVSGLLQLGQRYPGSFALWSLNAAISIAAPLLVILSFRPPRWIRSRLDPFTASGA